MCVQVEHHIINCVMIIIRGTTALGYRSMLFGNASKMDSLLPRLCRYACWAWSARDGSDTLTFFTVLSCLSERMP